MRGEGSLLASHLRGLPGGAQVLTSAFVQGSEEQAGRQTQGDEEKFEDGVLPPSAPGGRLRGVVRMFVV